MNPKLLEFPNAFESDRLLIRMPYPQDAIQLNHAIRETFDQLNLWMPWAKDLPTLHETEDHVKRKRIEFLERKDLTFHVFLKNSETLVASSGLHRIDWTIPRFEIGYWCCRSFQNRGYVTESTNAITNFAFDQLNARRIEIHVDEKNEISKRIPIKLGFELEATLKNAMRSNCGELRKRIIFAKVKDD